MIKGFVNAANTKNDKKEINISYIIHIHYFITQEVFLKQFYLNNTKINVEDKFTYVLA